MTVRKNGLTTGRKGFLAILIAVLTCRAAAAVPDIAVSVGFGNLFRPGTVVPVGVMIRSTDAPFAGNLVVEYQEGTSLERVSRRSIRRTVELPAGFSGVYRFVLPMESSTYPLAVRIETGGMTAARSEMELRPLITRRPLIVGLSRRPSLDRYIPAFTEAFGTRSDLRYPRVEFLPEEMRGWEGVDLVLWHDLPGTDPDAAALTALLLWVEAGGCLVLMENPALAGTWPDGMPVFPETPAGKPGILPHGAGFLVFTGTGEGSDETDRALFSVLDDLGIFDTAGGSGTRETVLRQTTRAGAPEAARIAAAAFSDTEPVAGPVGRVLVVPGLFAVLAVGILFAGRRSGSGRLRLLQTAILVIVGAGAVLAAAGGAGEPEVKVLETVVVPENGVLRRERRLRFVSSRKTRVSIPVESAWLPLVPDRTDLDINLLPTGPVIEEFELRPWTPAEIILEKFETKTADGTLLEALRDEAVLITSEDVRYPDAGAVSQSAAFRRLVSRLSETAAAEESFLIAEGESAGAGSVMRIILFREGVP